MAQETHSKHPEDIFVWPDESWCHRFDLLSQLGMSDDYIVLYVGTQQYEAFFEDIDF